MISRLKIVEACYWIVKNEMIKKNRNNFSPLYQIMRRRILFILLMSWTSSLKLETNDSKKTLYLTNKSEPANLVCSINSDISLKSYFYFDRFYSPLQITFVRVNNFFNKYSKMRSNPLSNTTSNFNSNRFSKVKNQIVQNFIKCYLSVLCGKANKSLLVIKNIKKSDSKHSNNYIKDFIPNVVDSLKQLYPEKDGIYTKITSRFLANPEFLKLAYSQIKNKKGNLTYEKNDTKIKLNKISQNWFQNTALLLNNGNYKFDTNQKINIQKNKTKNHEPISITKSKNKIIQKAIKLILEEIYERKNKTFSSYSHGFRPNKTCHTALKQIKKEWAAIPWFLKIDIRNLFGAINRNILISQLKLKIKDQRLFEILLKMFKANMIFAKEIPKKYIYIAQSNILSPILTNIFFHDLDIYVIKEIIDRCKKKIKTTKCFDYQQAVFLTYEKKKTSKQKKKHITSNKRKEAHNSNFRCIKLNDSCIRTKYIRYADDILIGVQGPRTLAEKIFRSIIFFLKSNLQLNVNKKKSKILNSFSNKIPFLGILIHNVTNKHVFYRKNRAIENKNHKRFRIISRINTLEHHQIKLLKNECLSFLSNSYNKYRNNRTEVKKNFISFINNSLTFKSLFSTSNRFIYKEFLKDLQKITEINENKKLYNFLHLWEQEISNNINGSKHKKIQKPILKLITKKEIIDRIVKILKKQHNLPAYVSDWWTLFQRSHEKHITDWKIIWKDNFKLSKSTISELRHPVNGMRG